jgi:hypothetical protein
MYVLAFRGLVGACVYFVDPHSTRGARYWYSCVCVGLCIRTYVARYLFRDLRHASAIMCQSCDLQIQVTSFEFLNLLQLYFLTFTRASVPVCGMLLRWIRIALCDRSHCR